MRTLLRSCLITPGIDFRMLKKAAASEADLVHIELEDGVTSADKQRARETIRDALTTLDWQDKVTFVRVNARDTGFLEDDIREVVPGRPTAILQGKCQGPQDIVYLDGLITIAELDAGIPYGTVKIASMIERAAALEEVSQLAAASARLMALFIGASDLGNEYGYRRAYRGQELETLWARSRVVLAAHHAGLLAIDSPYLYFTDLDGTESQSRWAYTLGFDLKACVSPRQLPAVNRAFTPSRDEIEWAEDVLKGETEATLAGRAVWAVDGMMTDAPFALRAEGILQRARAAEALTAARTDAANSV